MSHRGNRMCTQMSPLWMANQSMNDYQRLMFLVPLPLETIQPFNTLSGSCSADPHEKNPGTVSWHHRFAHPSWEHVFKQKGHLIPTLPPRSCRFFLPVTQWDKKNSCEKTSGSQAHKISTVTAACWSSFESLKPCLVTLNVVGQERTNRTAISCDFFLDALN